MGGSLTGDGPVAMVMVPVVAALAGMLAGTLSVSVYRAFRADCGWLLAAVAVVPMLALVAADWLLLGGEGGWTHPSPLRLVDAVVIVLAVALTAWRINRRGFYCEECGRWVKGKISPPPVELRIPEATAFALLAKGDVSPLMSACPVVSSRGTGIEVQVRHCRECWQGMMWIARVRGGRRERIAELQRVRLRPDAVRRVRELKA